MKAKVAFNDDLFIGNSKMDRRNDFWFAHNPKNVPTIVDKRKRHVLNVVSTKAFVMASSFF